MCNLNAPFFNNEDQARAYLEGQRWPQGPICPHCGCDERIYPVAADSEKKIRKGLYQCNDCNGQFTVTVGTVFERSKIPLHKWLAATYLLCSSKKGISAKQIERSLGVTYKTAWFMCHRIREAMRDGNPGLLGGGGKTVEVDETYIGPKTRRLGEKKRPRGPFHKVKVLTLVERTGHARSFHVPKVTSKTLHPIIKKHISKKSRVITDEATYYAKSNKFMGYNTSMLEKDFASHEYVNHGIGEYVRGNVHTNTIEGYFSIFKRGLNGIYQHVSEQHLKRYLCEYDFRYSFREKLGYNDIQRTNEALKGIEGKRLTYGRPHQE